MQEKKGDCLWVLSMEHYLIKYLETIEFMVDWISL